jgi:tetratricopeptide (TPR) repeat protein
MEKQDIDENSKNHGKTGAAIPCRFGLFVPWRTTIDYMMKKATTKLLALLLCPILLTAQENRKADSLLKILPAAKEDTNKVKLLLSIADEFENNDPHRALDYVGQAAELSRQLKYEFGILKSYRHASYIYSLVSKWDSMILYNRWVYDMVKNTKDSFNIGVSLYNLGVAYRFMSDLDSAVEYVLQGSRMLENKGYHNIEATLNDGLQSLYYTLMQFDKAIVYGKKAVDLARKLDNQMTLCTSLSNLGLSYMEHQSNGGNNIEQPLRSSDQGKKICADQRLCGKKYFVIHRNRRPRLNGRSKNRHGGLSPGQARV